MASRRARRLGSRAICSGERKSRDARSPVWLTCARCFGQAGREKESEYLVDVRLFFGKRELGDALVLDPDEDVVAEELLDEGVLEGGVGAV